MNQKELIKKRKEWNSLRNLIPIVQAYLNLDNIVFDYRHLHECPDFIFENNGHVVGIEVVECHPSVQRNKKKNASSNLSFQNRVCEAFMNNEFLKSITETNKINILIDRGYKCVNGVPIKDICHELEMRLKTLFQIDNSDYKPNLELIRRIRVRGAVGSNIVQFNCIARRNEIDGAFLKKSIIEKEEKLKAYIEKTKCDEFWLCIALPFEENCHSNYLYYNNEEQENEIANLLASSKYKRICLTSVMPNDLNWLKGNPNQ